MADIRSRDGPVSDTISRSQESAFKFDRRQSDESIPQLLRDLVQQGGHLAEQQTKLVQAEVRSAVSDVSAAAGAMAGAGVVAIAALGVFLMGLSFLLAQAIPLWGATLLVSIVTMVVAYSMFVAGRKKIENSSLGMDRSRHSIERAPQAIAGTTNGEQRHGR